MIQVKMAKLWQRTVSMHYPRLSFTVGSMEDSALHNGVFPPPLVLGPLYIFSRFQPLLVKMHHIDRMPEHLITSPAYILVEELLTHPYITLMWHPFSPAWGEQDEL